jgi:hypothetical protein
LENYNEFSSRWVVQLGTVPASKDITEFLAKYDWLRALYVWRRPCGHYGLTIQILSHLTQKPDKQIRREMKDTCQWWWKNRGPSTERALYSPGRREFTMEKIILQQVWCSTTQLPVIEFTGVYDFNTVQPYETTTTEAALKWKSWRDKWLPPRLRTIELNNWKRFPLPSNDEQARRWLIPIGEGSWALLKKAVAFS